MPTGLRCDMIKQCFINFHISTRKFCLHNFTHFSYISKYPLKLCSIHSFDISTTSFYSHPKLFCEFLRRMILRGRLVWTFAKFLIFFWCSYEWGLNRIQKNTEWLLCLLRSPDNTLQATSALFFQFIHLSFEGFFHLTNLPVIKSKVACLAARCLAELFHSFVVCILMLPDKWRVVMAVDFAGLMDFSKWYFESNVVWSKEVNVESCLFT